MFSNLAPQQRTSSDRPGIRRARSGLIKWCVKAARQYDDDSVLSFLGVA